MAGPFGPAPHRHSLRTGPALVNRLQVEHEAESPSYGALPQTRAVRTEAGRRITGRKRCATGAPLLAWLMVIENAIRAVDLALEIAGNHGLVTGGALQRHHRDVICGRTHPPGAALVRQTAGARTLAEA